MKEKKKITKSSVKENSSFLQNKEESYFSSEKSILHTYGKNHICNTDVKGYPTPNNANPAELVLDASEGFIPLWAKNVNLRWRFNNNSFIYFENPEDAKNEIRKLFSKALLAWGDSSPITFSERVEAWDFEITIRPDNCNINGCVLASAFFPDSGRHELVIHPKMFTQSEEEQVETLIHEIGHIFGLRHFFANISETGYPSVIFGKHQPFSIMNYGPNSRLTNDDKKDLKSLYEQVWKGELTRINGTKIVLFRSFHQVGNI
ncbi:matrix metalloproteinase-11 [Lacihabitans sp. CCS-44]|uniref:matrixin family metalloprotease n=1 Tax=Lacihabitans sp. CCS-44 TaxID=2487331 RepID=UPI0020CB73AE|nr:matrixin family metalloprotease [Lacihabitans sp. CCS-44]MCP9753888.1 matrix metalloproteinase-11 [Lacihabitans sp. CCS-44]